jgi:catechol 2,3-dioxygenase-like lactoylglutathione lyase family enzyme
MFEYIHHIAYVVSDIEDALRIFRDTFGLEISDRRVIEGETSVEMLTFRCGPSLIEVIRPIHHPALAQFLSEHGPGLHHVSFAMTDLSKRVEELKEKGVFVHGPFVAGTGWRIAYFDFEKSDLDLLKSCYHGDHIAEANTRGLSYST